MRGPEIDVTGQMQDLLAQATPKAEQAAEEDLRAEERTFLRDQMKAAAPLLELVHGIDSQRRHWRAMPWRGDVRLEQLHYSTNSPSTILTDNQTIFSVDQARSLGEALLAAADTMEEINNAPAFGA